jgi:hypothetical protein
MAATKAIDFGASPIPAAPYYQLGDGLVPRFQLLSLGGLTEDGDVSFWLALKSHSRPAIGGIILARALTRPFATVASCLQNL